MAEHDYVIANQNGANTRSDLNNALAAIVSNNSKASAPTTTYAYMWWADTANDILKQRNGADSAWISILTLSTGAPLATIANFTSTGIDDNATSTAITIDASENVLVGKTTTGYNDGIELNSGDYARINRDSGTALYVGRNTNDGEIISLRKDGTTVGSIGSSTNTLSITSARPEITFTFASASLYMGAAVGLSPGTAYDNTLDLGRTSARFDDVYATNGTIQTSDRNEKQDIDVLSVAEQKVALACKGLMRKFRWQDAVAEKGDDARIHFGIIAQDLQDAFAAEGLDAGRYAMFISTTWYEKLVPVDAVIGVEAVEATYDDEGAELTPAVEEVEAKDAYTRTDTEEEPTDGYTERTRLGVRYPELLAFIISAM